MLTWGAKILEKSTSRLRAAVIFATLCFMPKSINGQDLPFQTDIYVADLSVFEGIYYIGDLQNITNRPNFYDNQPVFTSDSRSILYTSAYDDGEQRQTEINRYYLELDRTTRITRTTKSEYAPAPIPGDKAFSAIQTETDSIQKLWRFTMEGMDAEVILRDVPKIDYYAWGNEQSILIFVIGNPPTLQIADVTTGLSEITTDSGVGISMHKIPNRNSWSFIERTSDQQSWISEVNIGTHEILRLIQTPSGSDFHAWTPDGILLMTSRGQVVQWDPEIDNNHRVIANFRHMNLILSYISVSPNGEKIAIVGMQNSKMNPDEDND